MDENKEAAEIVAELKTELKGQLNEAEHTSVNEVLPGFKDSNSEEPPPESNQDKKPGTDQKAPPPPKKSPGHDLTLKMIVKILERGTIKAFEKTKLTDEEKAFNDEERENWTMAIEQSAPAILNRMMDSPYSALIMCVVTTYGGRFLIMQERNDAEKNQSNEQKEQPTEKA